MKNLILFVILFSSCKSAPPISRVAFEAKSFGDFIITNSNTSHLYSMKKRKKNLGYNVQHRYIIKNDSFKASKLLLSKKVVVINNNQQDVGCAFSGTKDLEVSIDSQKMIYLSCHFTIEANEKNQLKNKDTTAYIQLTMNGKKVEFTHLIYRRDFHDKK